MKVLTIAPEPFFTPRGTPFSVYHRSLVMAREGVEVDLLTYGQGHDVPIPGVRVLRIPRLPFGPVRVGPSALKAVLDVLLFCRAAWLLLRKRYDVVHAHEEAAFFCLVLKPLFGFRFCYDMHSSLPQQLTNFEFTRSRLLIWLFERLEKACLRRADAVVTISPALAEHALAHMPDGSRHMLIENSLLEPVRLPAEAGAEADAAREVDPVRLPEPPAGRRLVVYAGTLEPYQGIDLLIDALGEVRRVREEVFLLVLGGAEEQVEGYRRDAARLGLDGWCAFVGQVDQGTARRWVSRADVLVSPRIVGTNTPLKLYEQLASGIPLVATRIPAHTQVVDESVCFLVDPDPASLACGIRSVLDDPARAAEVARRAAAFYEMRYGRHAYERKVRRLLSLLERPAGSEGT